MAKPHNVKRQCDWCDLRGPYDVFPDGSLASNGWLACADCLTDPKVARVMELVRFADVLTEDVKEGNRLVYG